jgi:cytochrome oxidase assembly protein ShyY1
LRFVLSRRWLVFGVVVVLLAYAAWWLGEWQFRRLAERKDSNAVVRANEDRPAAPVEDVLHPGRDVDPSDEWRMVRAIGTYDAGHTIVIRYRTRDGASGVDVVVPLVTPEGTALLVDRGWLETDPRGADRDEIPDPPEGQVDVTGWVRADGEGDSTVVTDLSARAVDSERIAEAIGRPTFGGFVELRSEDPPAATALEPVELPELDNGPHFFYGLQWWFFGLLAVFGFFYLLYDEWRHGPRGARREVAQSERSIPPSTGTMAPVTNEAAGESRKAATRPNSSGSP